LQQREELESSLIAKVRATVASWDVDVCCRLSGEVLSR
jgi:hypothetical protein